MRPWRTQIIKGSFGEAACINYGDRTEIGLIIPPDRKFERVHECMRKSEKVHPVDDIDELREYRLGHGSLDNLWMPGTSDKVGIILLDHNVRPDRAGIEAAMAEHDVPIDAVIYLNLRTIPEAADGTINLKDLYGNIPEILSNPSQLITTDFNSIIPYSISNPKYPVANGSGSRMIHFVYDLFHGEPVVIATDTPFKSTGEALGLKDWLFKNRFMTDDLVRLKQYVLKYVLERVNDAHKFHGHMGALVGNFVLGQSDLDDSALDLVYHRTPEVVVQTRMQYKAGRTTIADHLAPYIGEDNSRPVELAPSVVPLYEFVY